jgi:hypothetical protein
MTLSMKKKECYPTSTPPTVTVIFIGNGDIPVLVVIGGTALRPRSDDVCVRIVSSDLESKDAKVELNSWRSLEMSID